MRELDPLVGLDHLGAVERRWRWIANGVRSGACASACTWSPGGARERLRFDFQKLLAERLGYADDGDSLAVEKMMQGFYRSAAIVRRINDRLLQRFEEHFDGAAEPQALDDDLELRRGYLATRKPGWLRGRHGKRVRAVRGRAADTSLRGLHSQTARGTGAPCRDPGIREGVASLARSLHATAARAAAGEDRWNG